MSEPRRRRIPDTNSMYPESTASTDTTAQEAAFNTVPHEEPSYTAPQYANSGTDNRTIIVNQINTAPAIDHKLESYFDGGLLSLIGWSILAGLLTAITLGFGYPFAACMLYRWEARHTVINGRRLCFDGNGLQLIGKWIVWMLLTIITLGIYSFWLVIKMKQWRIKHTHFAK